jgi:glutamine phosphoribosylpyrophosphate amidotransferase
LCRTLTYLTITTHNGNLTNFHTLRDRLVSDGAIFQSTSDSEVILHLLARSRKAKVVDRFIDAMVLNGDAASVKAGLRRHFAAGATHVCIQPVTEDGDTASRDAMLKALADT